jgi:hypothetical protein
LRTLLAFDDDDDDDDGLVTDLPSKQAEIPLQRLEYPFFLVMLKIFPAQVASIQI